MIRATRPAALARVTLAAACAVALTGCISVFPKTKPAQLYRFDYAAPAAAAATPSAAGPRADVYLANGSFPLEASSDQILTLNGAQAAYIAQSRWVSPAAVLWDEAVHAAFASAGGVRLISHGEPARSAYALRLDVLKFEADYDGGAPNVEVRVHATLSRTRDRTVIGEQTFDVRTPADANRVSAIVRAYDQAVGQVLRDIVGWTNSQAVATA